MAFSFLPTFTKPIHAPRNDEDFAPLVTFAHKRGLHYEIASSIFYHKERIDIPFLLFDRHRGIYLFDTVSWDAAMLRTLKAAAAPKHTKKAKDVNVDTAHRTLMLKLDEVQNHQACEIVNFLYLPNLERAAYETLDPSFAALLPPSRVIFADDDEDAISQKLANALSYREHPVDLPSLLGALYIQYTLLPGAMREGIRQLTPQQKQLLYRKLPRHSVIYGPYGSGKSSLVLLKAVYDKLRRPERSIAIIQPTLAACESMSAQLLQIIEHAVVHIDPTAIRIATPQQICREHYIKVHKEPPLVDGNITDKMQRRSFHISDVLFLDDAYLLDRRYLDYFRSHHKGELHLVLTDPEESRHDAAYPLEHGFRLPHSLRRYLEGASSATTTEALQCLEGNAYIIVLNLLPHLLEAHAPETIMIVTPDQGFAASLQEEITDFTGCLSTLLDAHKTLLNQDMEQLLIVPMDELSGLQRDHVVVIRNSETVPESYRHAIGRAAVHAYVISHTSESL